MDRVKLNAMICSDTVIKPISSDTIFEPSGSNGIILYDDGWLAISVGLASTGGRFLDPSR